jgi:hypothetical protein
MFLNAPMENNHDMISQASGVSGLSKQLISYGKNFGPVPNIVGLHNLANKNLRLSPTKLGVA